MEHLSDIHTYYFLDTEDKLDIKPISRIDCEIIEILLSILEKQGNAILLEILSKWKLDTDNEIVSQLEEYLDSESLEEDMKRKGGDIFTKLIERMKRSYIMIGEYSLHSDKIFLISKRDSHTGAKPVYELVINDEKHLPQGTTSWYCNITTTFSTRELREEKIEEMKKLLSKNTMCKFLN